MAGALQGIRVLEVANFIAGPYAAMLLADLGAVVIKVENPDGGDPFRGWQYGGDQPTFWAYNRGKKSIILNLRSDEGKDVLRRLVRSADVLVENLRPDVMDRLGLGWAQLQEINPRLIYCSVTGFGPTGPYSLYPAYDGIGQAVSGMVSMLTDRQAPQIVGPNFSDSLSAMFAAYGILGALVARERTGRGQRVDSSLVGATLAFINAPATETLAGGPVPGPKSRPIASQTYAWTANDGLPLTVHLSSPPKFWQGLANAVGRPELIEDRRFRTQGDRRAHYDELRDELAPIFATKPRDEWIELLRELDVPCAPIYDLGEVFEDPQIRHMGLQITIERQRRPPIRTVASPVNLSDTPSPRPAPPPEFGEHTDEVLASVGYDVAEIETLRARGVLSGATDSN
ncbi:MAG TPA: CaiB/BaiF CoA-transferase family protein [Chloroflexota bacterium]|nr:CaiB/BaiF CoA-transferase family protein [Chloroflexota bacterium]